MSTHWYGVKTCPRCGAQLFEDMDICYECLYDFNRAPLHTSLPDPDDASRHKGQQIEKMRREGKMERPGHVERLEPVEHMDQIEPKVLTHDKHTLITEQNLSSNLPLTSRYDQYPTSEKARPQTFSFGTKAYQSGYMGDIDEPASLSTSLSATPAVSETPVTPATPSTPVASTVSEISAAQANSTTLNAQTGPIAPSTSRAPQGEQYPTSFLVQGNNLELRILVRGGRYCVGYDKACDIMLAQHIPLNQVSISVFETAEAEKFV